MPEPWKSTGWAGTSAQPDPVEAIPAERDDSPCRPLPQAPSAGGAWGTFRDSSKSLILAAHGERHPGFLLHYAGDWNNLFCGIGIRKKKQPNARATSPGIVSHVYKERLHSPGGVATRACPQSCLGRFSACLAGCLPVRQGVLPVVFAHIQPGIMHIVCNRGSPEAYPFFKENTS